MTTDDGIKIHYLDTETDGPALMLGHGFFMDAEMWLPQLEELADHYRVIAVDARGHGRTEDSGNPFTYWDLAWDAWKVADALGLDRLVLGGLSQGGFTALRMALLQPDRTRALVLIGTTAAAYTEQEREGYERVIVKSWVGGAVPIDDIALPMAAVMIGGDRDSHQRPWVEKWRASDRGRLAQAARCLIDREDLTELLAEIKAPALLLRGIGDQAFSHQHMSDLAAGLGGPARVKTISADTATHICNLTHPELVTPEIREFLDSLPA
ncbi:alpha/beta fold hydrolase [Nocardia aurantiaca]|uniref:Alpha/beta fold hydrolase n=1 Tax=Nocardia aurantiaca TaxID=2675850 RepID=A0A6I3KVI8_9NOCA|nr:alpha/beta hydrolase [Nocardia aurantiaca]MTE11519.1 alpha/beta fold hydrolase [Nocardia aurantiaca]